MMFSEFQTASRPGLLTLVEAPSQQAHALRIEAERCFRLAQGIASVELADELEALGRAFESESEQLATSPIF
jgi:hypothetical protein